MQRVFKENDIVWRKLALNDEVSYYRVTKDIIRPDIVSAISLLDGTLGVIQTSNLKYFWLQIGDKIIHADEQNDGIVLEVANIRHQGSRLVIDVVYPNRNIGTFSISEQFCRSITLL